jgi:hypothetical protein
MTALDPNRIRLYILSTGIALTLAPPVLAADVSVQLDAGFGFSVKNSTGAIERLRVDEATGNLSRNGALFVHTTGANNVFVGEGVGNLATTGYGANTALGDDALLSNTTGCCNSAVGKNALRNNTTGLSNSAFGAAALYANTTGVRNSAVGVRALFANTTGVRNSAVGYAALQANSSGDNNSAVGYGALRYNNTGAGNAAFGHNALRGNATGANNSAFGGSALRDNTASSNSAFGFYALNDNTSGGNNAAFGNSALRFNTTGSGNVAMGIYAGQNQTTGSNNIYIANSGQAGENSQIKIGTVGNHTQATIAGIHNATSSGGIAVLINASGTLGTTTSSARFKTDVHDMQGASDVLMRLRPVVFHYREEAVGAEEAKATQYGLIAEEVAQVAPELVAPDLEGKPYSVRYHVLAPMLLNQVQKQQRTIDAQRRENQAQEARIAALTTRLARLESRR